MNKKSPAIKDRYFVVARIKVNFPIKMTKSEKEMISKAYPVGCIVNFAYKKETDEQLEKWGFLPCKGQKYDSKKWPDLHNVVGRMWGNTVPDLIHRISK